MALETLVTGAGLVLGGSGTYTLGRGVLVVAVVVEILVDGLVVTVLVVVFFSWTGAWAAFMASDLRMALWM